VTRSGAQFRPRMANSPNEENRGRIEPSDHGGRSAPKRSRPIRNQTQPTEEPGTGGTPGRGPALEVPPGFQDARRLDERPIRGIGQWRSMSPTQGSRRAQLDRAFQRGAWSSRPEERPASPLSRAYGQNQRGGSNTYIPGATATVGTERRTRIVEQEEFAQNPNEDEAELETEGIELPQIPQQPITPREKQAQQQPAILKSKSERQKRIAELLSLLAQDEAEGTEERSAFESGDPEPRRPYSPPMNERIYEKSQASRRPYSPPMSGGQNDDDQLVPEKRSYFPPMNFDRRAEEENERTNREETDGPEIRQAYSTSTNDPLGRRGRTKNGPSGLAQPEHSLLRSQKGDGQPAGSAYLPSGVLPSRTDALRHAGSTGHVAPPRGPAMLDPIMQPVGTVGPAAPVQPNLLYGPPLLVYAGRQEKTSPLKHSATPDSPPLGGRQTRKGRRPGIFWAWLECTPP
jgi:hypothetical protein